MALSIQDALKKLDPSKDEQWTGEGLPKLDTLKLLCSNPGLSREAVNAAVPGFTRAVALQAAVPAPPDSPTDPVAQAPAAPAHAQINAELFPNLAVNALAAPALDELEKQIEQAQLTCTDCQQTVQSAQVNYKKAQDVLDVLLEKKAQMDKPNSNQQKAIQGYLAQQRQNLQDRGARIKAVRESGIDLKNLARGLKAPIDAVRARNTTIGSVRR